MFNKSAAQLVSTRSMAKSSLKNDENKLGKSVAVDSKAAAAAVVTRKRRALGDVSNSISAAATTKQGKAKASSTVAAADKALKPSATVAPVAKKAVEKAHVEKEKKKVAVVIDKQAVEAPKRQKLAYMEKWQELDAADLDDPVMVAEYVNEIFEYLRDQELKVLPDARYMLKQQELQWKMRTILIDWLIEVHQKFQLLQETLFLAVNIIDRFLSIRAVSLSKLQLVGITSLFIAAKYEEVFAPSINQFVYITDGGYTNEELIKAERFILSTLEFNLQYPNPLNFLRRISRSDHYDLNTRTIGKYLMEITLLDESFLSDPPSLIAASAMYIARHVNGSEDIWDSTTEHYAGYAEEQLESCVTKMIDYLHKEAASEAIYTKYSTERQLHVSIIVEKWMERCVANRDFDMPWL